MKPVEIEFLMKGNLGRGLDDARRKAESLDSVLRNVGAAVGIAFGTRQAAEFARKVMDVRGEVESLQISFETLAGKAKGSKLFGDIREWVVNTPMMMQPVAKGAQTLLGFNVEAEKVMPILRQIGDISMGDAQKFNSLTLAFAQMSSTGRLMGQDLLQMINAGFNPLVVISEKTGKSMAALKRKMADGRISVRMVEEAFASATAEGGRFYGMLEKQSKGIKGAMSNLQGAWEDMLNDIGEKSQGEMVNAINQATELVKDYEKVLDVLEQIVVAYGSYKAALMLVVAAQKAMALAENIRLVMMFRREMGLLTAAQQAFNRAALVNPYVLIGVAAAGAGVAIYNLAKADNAAEAAQKKLNRTVEEANQQARDHQKELDELTRRATAEAASTDDRRTAMQQLVDKYPSIIEKYIDEKGHLTDIINLKREIARLDGLDKQQKLEGDYQRAQRYTELYNRARKGQQLSNSERDELNSLADDAWEGQDFWTRLGKSKTGFAADYYKNQLPGLKRSVARSRTENMLREFNYGLEKMTDDELLRMSKDAQAALRNIGEKNSAYLDNYTHDFLTSGDLGERLGIIGNILEQRHPKKGDGGGSWSGKTDKLLKEQREQAARAIEEERRWQEEIAKTRQTAADAQRDAQIAAVQNDGERERAEQDEQHKRNLRQIADQADEMRKAVYEHNKTAWEAAHKDSPYELTDEGQAGWSDIQLSDEQKAIIDSRIKKENEEYLRTVIQRQKDEIKAMRDYLKEYGTLQERKYAIAKEYDDRIANETGWRRKSLEQEKKYALNSIDIEALRSNIDWTMMFDGLGDAFQKEIKETVDRIEAYMKTEAFRNLDATQKREYIDMRNSLYQKTGSSHGVFNFSIYGQIGREMAEFQSALRASKEAQNEHTRAVMALNMAEEDLKDAEDRLEKARGTEEQTVAQQNVNFRKAVLENAKRQVDRTGEEQKEAENNVVVAQGRLRKSVDESRKTLDNFGKALDQITSGTLKGFADGLVNLYNTIVGNGRMDGLAGLGRRVDQASEVIGKASDVTQAVDDALDAGAKASKAIGKGTAAVQKTATEATGAIAGTLETSGNVWGMIVAAILELIDTLGEDPGGVISEIIDKIFGVIEGIFEQLQSGEFIGGIVHSIIEGIGRIFGQIIENLEKDIASGNGIFQSHFLNQVDQMFGLGLFGKEETYEQAKERYEHLVDIWDTLIEKKREYLAESWGPEAEKASEEALRLLRVERTHNEELAKWLLGEGSSMGSHSYGYRMWQGSYSSKGEDNLGLTNTGILAKYAGDINWKDVNEAIRRGLMEEGLGNVAFDGMEDLLRMNADQLNWIKMSYAGLWNSMDDDFRQYLENTIQFSETETEILESLREQITGTSFDNVFDSFMSSLYDLADGAEDVFGKVGEDWQKMSNKMVLNNIVGEKYKSQLREWYDQWYEAYMGDKDIDRQEIGALRDSYNDLVRAAADEVKALRDQGIVTGIEDSQGQTANRGGFSALSQDQGTKLDGMFTAGLQHWSSMDDELGSCADRLGTALDHLRRIEENTDHCRKLDDIAEDIRQIRNQGLKIK